MPVYEEMTQKERTPWNDYSLWDKEKKCKITKPERQIEHHQLHQHVHKEVTERKRS